MPIHPAAMAALFEEAEHTGKVLPVSYPEQCRCVSFYWFSRCSFMADGEDMQCMGCREMHADDIGFKVIP